MLSITKSNNDKPNPPENEISQYIALSNRIFSNPLPSDPNSKHQKALAKLQKLDKDSIESSKICSQIAEYYLQNNKYHESFEYFQLHYATNRKHEDPNAIQAITSLIKIATIQSMLCNFQEAHKSLDDCLQMWVSNSGHNSILIEIYKTKAKLLTQQARYNDALLYIEKLKQIPAEKCNLEDNNIELAVLEAKIYGSQAEIDKMKERQDYALKELKMLDDKINKNKYAEYWNVIGFLCRIQGQYEQAIEYYKLSLKASLEGEINDLLLIADSYVKVGELYMLNGDFATCMRVLKEAERICLGAIPEDHPQNATYLAILGRLYTAQGNLADAKEPLNKSLEIRIKVLGKDHPLVADTYQKLGEYYIFNMDFKLGHESFIKALDIQTACFQGKYHHDIAVTYHGIGKSLYLMEDYLGAKDQFEKALKTMTSLFGEDHPLAADSYGSLGTSYGACGNSTMHLKYLKKALQIHKKILGKNHIKTASHYQSLSLVYLRLSEHDKAFRKCNKAIQIRTKAYGRSHPLVSEAYFRLATVCQAKGAFDEAIQYARISLQISLKFDLIAETRNIYKVRALAYLFGKVNNFEEAERYYKIFAIANKKAKQPISNLSLDAFIDKSVGLFELNASFS